MLAHGLLLLQLLSRFLSLSGTTVSHGAVVQQVERWTCDQQVTGSNPTRGKSCVSTLGKFFTPMRLCHQAV